MLAVVTGVAGSGKSSLIDGSVSGRDGVVSIDQTPIRGSRRSNPATYTGLLDPIRSAFAKANGVKPALFSANSEGACPTCNGAGVIYTDLGMMAGVTTVCEECEGRRFQASVLDYRLPSTSLRAGGGLNIAEVLDLSVEDDELHFSAPARRRIRRRTRSCSGWPTWGSATCGSANRSPRYRVASGNGSSSPRTWVKKAASMSSTS